jgi:hypothetical protein
MVETARASAASAIECWLPAHHPYQPLLRREGFLHTRDAAILFLPLGAPEDAIQYLDDPLAAVHYTLGDSDLV